MIKLFESTAREFDTLGLGVLNDAIKSIVVEERNGSFELEMDYPIDGIHYDKIKLRSLIVCKSNPFSKEQAFRVYYMSKPINGIVNIKAEHISYDLSGMVVSPLTAKTAQAALMAMKQNSTPACDFNFTSDKDVIADFEIKVPSSLRSYLGGVEGSILDVFGTGEYEFDNFDISFRTHRGSDRGVQIRYGKNLTDLTQEENCTKVYTAVYPYWAGTKYENEQTNDILITLPEKIIDVEGTFDFSRVYPLDLSSKIEYTEDDNEDSIRAKLKTEAQNYINQNGIGKPEVSLKVSFVQLEQAEEYEQLRLLESVSLCDTVAVIFEKLGVDSTAKCIKTEYNVLTGKYESLEFGDSSTNLANTIVNQSEAIANVPTASFMEREIAKTAKIITSDGLGGYVKLHRSSGQSEPDELLILDEESGGDYLKSKNIWRFNRGGLGFSDNYYNSEIWKIGITMDGRILADEITAKILKGLTLISPTIQNDEENPTFTVDAQGNIKGATLKAGVIGNGQEIDSTTIDITAPSEGNSERKGIRLLFGAKSGYPNGCNVMISDSSTHGEGPDDGFGVIANPLYESQDGAGSGLFMHHHRLNYYWYHNGNEHGDGIWNKIDFRYGTFYSGPGAHSNNLQWHFNVSSDRRLKENIEDIPTNIIQKLFKKIRFKRFDFKNNIVKRKSYGLIAQEAEELLDEIGIDKTEFVEIGKDGYYTLNYQEFTKLCIPAIKDLYEQVEKLQNEVNELKRGDQVE